jgi:hypothetical protein
VTTNTDCNDAANSIYPGAAELCSTAGVDNNCNGNIADIDDNAADKVDFYRDSEGDGFTTAETQRFCPGSENPGWRPAPSSPLDCDDAAFTYADGDGDGFGAGAATACGVTNNADCNDAQLTYADNDGDGFGAGAPSACGVTSNTDCNDASAAINPNATEICDAANTDEDCDGAADDADSQAAGKTTWYLDVDLDGYGVAGSTLSACDRPTGYAPIAGDVCPENATKQTSAGVCGCALNDTDVDGDNRIDCVDIELSLLAMNDSIEAGVPYIVRVNAHAISPILPMSGMQLAVKFDATRLSLDAVVPVATCPFGLPIAAQIVNTPDANGEGTLRYALGVDADDTGLAGSADLVDLVFSVKPGADLCAQDIRLARLAQVGSWRNLFVTFDTIGVTPELYSLGFIDLDTSAPDIAGVPDSVAIPADAGSSFGAFVAAPTVVTSDNCTGGLVADLLVTYPAPLGTATAWPTDGMFPIGVTTLEWRASDETGNETVLTRTVTVHDYQLLDLDVSFNSLQKGPSTRAIRLTTGVAQQMIDVVMPRWVGNTRAVASVTGIQVPVAAGYGCMAVKDSAHSLSATAAPTIVGTRYKASVVLKQGDSNDDDKVDIADFSLFVADRGGPVATNARSNFNGDALVDNADFGNISINFFLRGDTCTGLGGGEPLSRISVKELRRQGLGEAAVADLNGDGWVDTRDIQIYMQGGQVPGTLNTPNDGVISGW